jgi:predicted nicotinamide N-methyase
MPHSADRTSSAAERLDAALSHLDLVTSAVEAGGAKVVLRKPRSAEALICDDDFAGDERLPYWADVWPSARALAGSLRSMSGDGARLLELGCGVGLVSLTALRAGYQVTATDYYADALSVTRLNVLRLVGDEDARLQTRLVDWRQFPDDLVGFDVVCASDVLYEREYAELVAQAVQRAVRPSGLVRIADPGRAALSAFRDAMRSRGFTEHAGVEHSVPTEPAAGDLVQKARPGGAGLTNGSPGVRPAHRVTVFDFRAP